MQLNNYNNNSGYPKGYYHNYNGFKYYMNYYNKYHNYLSYYSNPYQNRNTNATYQNSLVPTQNFEPTDFVRDVAVTKFYGTDNHGSNYRNNLAPNQILAQQAVPVNFRAPYGNDNRGSNYRNNLAPNQILAQQAVTVTLRAPYVNDNQGSNYRNNLAPNQILAQQAVAVNSRAPFVNGVNHVTQYTYSDGGTVYQYYSQIENGQVVYQRVTASQQSVFSNVPSHVLRERTNTIKYNPHKNRPRGRKRNKNRKYYKDRSYYQHDRRTPKAPKEPRAWNYEKYMENKRRNAEIKKYTCSTCSEEFRNENALETHEKVVHAPEKDLLLDTMAFNAGLSDHSTPLKKEESKDIQCEFCPKKFPTKASFKRHMETIHTSLSANGKADEITKRKRECPFPESDAKIKKERLSFKFKRETSV